MLDCIRCRQPDDLLIREDFRWYVGDIMQHGVQQDRHEDCDIGNSNPSLTTFERDV